MRGGRIQLLSQMPFLSKSTKLGRVGTCATGFLGKGALFTKAFTVSYKHKQAEWVCAIVLIFIVKLITVLILI